MREFLGIAEKLVPELIDQLTIRLDLLYALNHLAPAGRRMLSQYLGRNERAIRVDTQAMRGAGLVDVTPKGMVLTEQGKELLRTSERLISVIRGSKRMADRIRKLLAVKQVIIVRGDSEDNPSTKEELGRAAAMLLLELLQSGQTVSVSGGTTLAALAQAVPQKSGLSDVIVVPARGGLGEHIEIQANNVAATIARKLNASYHPLYGAENLSVSAIELLSKEQQISEVVDLSRDADICVHGIGKSFEMAVRRGAAEETIAKLSENGAVAEVFGYYLDSRGNIVHVVPSLGLHFQDLDNIPTVIAVAGGRSKAQAIVAVVSQGYTDYLVADEAAALAICDLLE